MSSLRLFEIGSLLSKFHPQASQFFFLIGIFVTTLTSWRLMQIIKEEQPRVACSEQLDVAYQTAIVMKCGQKKNHFPCYLSNIF